MGTVERGREDCQGKQGERESENRGRRVGGAAEEEVWHGLG